MKPSAGFKLPSAGVTPAPGEKKSRNGEDAISLRGFLGEEGDDLVAAMFHSPRNRFPFPLGKGLRVRFRAMLDDVRVSRPINVFKMAGDVLEQPPTALQRRFCFPLSRGKGGEGTGQDHTPENF
jgi:hypothetical protein